jgi:hypothetical protein
MQSKNQRFACEEANYESSTKELPTRRSLSDEIDEI